MLKLIQIHTKNLGEKMVKVIAVIPESFDPIDFLNAYAAKVQPDLLVLNYDSGRRILDKVPNTQTIGLTYERPKNRQIGFPIKSSPTTYEDPDEVFDPQAILVLNPSGIDPSVLKDQDLDGQDTWELRVREYEKMDLYVPVAKALAEEFKVNVVLNPFEKKDQDPAHLEPGPVMPEYPNGPQFCRIIAPPVKK